MRFKIAAGLQVIISFGAFAQAPAFDVASVKQAPPSQGNFIRTSTRNDPGMVGYSSATLKSLIARAYNVREHQISGPNWLASERYDIVAKHPPNTPKYQIPLMMQSLLAERFKLALHREPKVLPVYALVLGKNGPKLKAADAAGSLRMEMGPKGRKMTGQVTIARLVEVLSNMLDRPVLDMTELAGPFDIELEWTPDGAPAETSDNPSIFAAIQEKLGLRLEARKSSVDILVIDRVEKVPVEN